MEIDMAVHMVNEVTSLINKQVDSHEEIQGCLLKAEALAHVALGEDFLEYSKTNIRNYLTALRDIIIQLKDLHESALNDLVSNKLRRLQCDPLSLSELSY